MSAMAAPPPHPPRLDSVLSFSTALPCAGAAEHPATEDVPDTPAFSDAGSDYDSDDDGFEFAFAPPLAAPADGLAPADDLFAHGRILPAYPVFDRHLTEEMTIPASPSASTAAPPSPDTYCAWAPRSAPGSPTRERDDAFPKSASTGEARRSWRLRDLVSGRSHSDGKEKFHFLHSATATAAAPSKMAGTSSQAAKPAAAAQMQSKKKGGRKADAGGVTEMDMATAHKLFYGKPGGGALAGDRRQQQSYLPYRPGIVGFFTTAHAIGRSHHPY
ncbi:unnamed protein product [Urochloa humidicola]